MHRADIINSYQLSKVDARARASCLDNSVVAHGR
jgi:hypothetical protein